MTQTNELPLQMRRNGFDPAEELGRARDGEGVVLVETPWGLPGYLVCRHEDVRRVLADPARFSSALTPLRGADALDPDELARMRAGQLIGLDPPEHTRLRRLLTPEFTVNRGVNLAVPAGTISLVRADDVQLAHRGPAAEPVGQMVNQQSLHASHYTVGGYST